MHQNESNVPVILEVCPCPSVRRAESTAPGQQQMICSGQMETDARLTRSFPGRKRAGQRQNFNHRSEGKQSDAPRFRRATDVPAPLAMPLCFSQRRAGEIIY